MAKKSGWIIQTVAVNVATDQNSEERQLFSIRGHVCWPFIVHKPVCDVSSTGYGKSFVLTHIPTGRYIQAHRKAELLMKLGNAFLTMGEDVWSNLEKIPKDWHLSKLCTEATKLWQAWIRGVCNV